MTSVKCCCDFITSVVSVFVKLGSRLFVLICDVCLIPFLKECVHDSYTLLGISEYEKAPLGLCVRGVEEFRWVPP